MDVETKNDFFAFFRFISIEWEDHWECIPIVQLVFPNSIVVEAVQFSQLYIRLQQRLIFEQLSTVCSVVRSWDIRPEPINGFFRVSIDVGILGSELILDIL